MMHVDMAVAEFVPGDPGIIVAGRGEEKPARVHAPQPPRPWSEARLRCEIAERRDQIDEERKLLTAALLALRPRGQHLR